MHEPSCSSLISFFLAVVFEAWELFPQDTLNSLQSFSLNIFILACNQNYLCLIVCYYMRCSCCWMCFFLILGDIIEQITASFSIPWISFYQILSVLEILLSQLHVSFVTMRQAQNDEMSEAFDLGLGVFCLLLVLPCCVILDMECHPCASWHSSACQDATLFWAGTPLQVYKYYSHTASLCAKQAVEVLF